MTSRSDQDSGAVASGWRGDLGVGATATAAFLVAWLAGGGLWTRASSGDLQGMFVPWYEFVAGQLWRGGRVPLWLPTHFAGMPALGQGQGGSLYPPVLILFGLLPSWTALQAFYALHVFILGAGMAALLRRHAIGRGPALMATLVAVAAVLRCPLLTGVDHPPFLASTSWMPVVLYCWERAAAVASTRWVAGMALATAMQWLAGYPDFALDFAVLLGVVALLSDVGTLRRRLVMVALGLGLGAALAAIQLVPLAEAVRESIRTEEGAVQAGIRSLFALFSSVQLERAIVGTWGPAAVALLLVGAMRPNRARLAWAAAFAWSVLALNPPFEWLYRLPPWSGVRFPFGWSGGTAVFLGLLAAAGLTRLWRSPRRWVRRLGGVLALAASGHALVLVWDSPRALPLLAFAGQRWRAPDAPVPDARAQQLAVAAGGARVLSERDATSGSGLRYGVPLAKVHEPSVAPRRIVHLLQAADMWENVGIFRNRDWNGLAGKPVVATLLGIGIVAIDPARATALERAGFRPAGTLPDGDVVLQRPTRPRVRLVHRAETVTGGEKASLAAVLRDARVAPEAVVLEAETVPGATAEAPAEPPAGAAESVRIIADEPERVVVEARVAAAGLLVLADTFYPGWQAEVDGVPTPILVSDHAFRAVRVSSGEHTVVFVYRPWSVRLGLAISLCAALATAACLTRRPRAEVIRACRPPGRVVAEQDGRPVQGPRPGARA